MSSSPAAVMLQGRSLSDNLAVERTQLAYDRTLMAWIRTSVSLISFGFTIYKFFELSGEKFASRGIIGPRRFAMFMIGTGIIALAIAVAEHWRDSHVLHKVGVARRSLASILAALVAVMGLLAMIAVVLRQ